MIAFNTLLRKAGVDPDHVKLARHHDTRWPGRTHELWTADDGRFDLYQQIQKREVFKDARMLASFVVTSQRETLFVGLYEIINGLDTAPPGQLDPVSGKNVGGNFLYKLTSAPQLAEYRGNLTIEWGPGYRSWVQLARKKDKPVLKIHVP
jgi:hypothetical protein